MKLITGRKCKWDEIEVGEIFACEGCWVVAVKISENESRLLASTHPDYWKEFAYSHWSKKFVFKEYNLYKLPKSVQRLWKEE